MYLKSWKLVSNSVIENIHKIEYIHNQVIYHHDTGKPNILKDFIICCIIQNESDLCDVVFGCLSEKDSNI